MIEPRRFVLGTAPRNAACGVVLAGAAAAAIGVAGDPQRTWPELLLNSFYIVGASLGGMVFIAIHYLSGAAWSASIRRIPEAMMAAVPVSAVLMLSLFFGREWIYPARDSGAHARYLGTPFFFGRMALFVVLWTIFAVLMRRTSVRQDADPSPLHHQRMVRYSAAFAVVLAVSFSLASFDWIMTLEPRWTSTIFAVYMFAGLLVQAVAAITLGVVLLRDRGHFAGIVNEDQLRDLGRLLFAFSSFWAYIWFSQYLLIWYGNIPEEATYYVRRTGEGWIALFLLNVVVNWAVPFLLLLSRSSKRNPIVLEFVAIVLLAGRWLDLYVTVMPNVIAAPDVRVTDALIAAGYAGVFFLAAGRALASVPLVPLNDPYLRESRAPAGRALRRA
jgi:Ni/Fe-hydrogenase subunit HybB-like protein